VSVATAQLRDLEELRAGLAGWLGRAYPASADLVIVDLRHASEGWSNETVVMTLGHPGPGDPAAPAVPDKVVVRLPPLRSSFPEPDDPRRQAALHRAVAAAGVPAPSPVTVVDDRRWVGVPFAVMPYVAGHVPGQAPVLDPWVAGSPPATQRALYDAFIDTVAAVNRIEWRGAGLGAVLRGGSASPAGPAGSLAAELDWWSRYLEWSLDGVPLAGLVDAFDWCRANAPVVEPAPSLLWGDPRLGNLVVDDDCTVVGVLDWELASVGPAELDLGWLLALEWSMDELIGRRVAGFPDRSETIGRYEEHLGRAVSDLEFHEVFALVRSAAISNRQARMAAAAGAPYALAADERHPLLGLLRRRIAEAGG